MARTIDTNEMIKRQGGELNTTNDSYIITDAQPEYVAPDKGTGLDSVSQDNFNGINSYKFDAIVAFFEKKGVPKTLARTYGASLLDATITTGKDITELVKVTESNKLEFQDPALEHINLFRPKTSQIGYRVSESDINNQNIVRAIVV